MIIVFKSILIFTSLAFLFYGYNCLTNEFMISEFERFGLSKIQRIITGIMQIIGALGLLTGLYSPKVGMISAIGLAVLMILGFVVRLIIKDSFFQSLPSFIFVLVNFYLAYMFFKTI